MHAVIRNVSWVVAAAVAVGGVFGELGGIARGQGIGVAEGSNLFLEEPILRENFDDNERSAIWRVYTEDSDNCSLVEVDHRLELRANPAASDAAALYVSNAWRFDPNADFSLKVDLQYTPVTYARGWIGFGLTTDSDKPRERQIVLGIGAADLYTHFLYRVVDDGVSDSGSAFRLASTATMYLSYDASADELYISDAGYGPRHAWKTFTGLIQGQWGGKPLYVWTGGSADGLDLVPGQAFADNLLVESGAVLEASLRDVYRFWSPKIEKHFYTIDTVEKETLLTYSSDVWTYEGAVFAAFQDDSDPATRPVYRFWSNKLSGHFYTIDEQEKNWLIQELEYVWTFEGVAFYAYPSGLRPPWASPVYRFWSPAKSTHFYTISQKEKDDLIAGQSKVWIYEGIAWYAVK